MDVIHEKAMLRPGVHQPRTLQEAWELKSKLGERALYVSGGTLLRTQWEAGTAAIPRELIDLRSVEGLNRITLDEDGLSLGALLTLSQCRRDPGIRAAAPAVQEAARFIAAPSVRNLATLGGNIASGFGDILPALLVYDTELVSFDGHIMNERPLTKWLAERWGTPGLITDSPPGEIIAEIRIPLQRLPEAGADGVPLAVFRKVGRREAFTPSLVTAAITVTAVNLDEGRVFRKVRIAAGGGSGRPQRLYSTEALLEGKILKESLLPAVYESVVEDFETYSDPFATEAYKKTTAGNLIAAELWKAGRTSKKP